MSSGVPVEVSRWIKYLSQLGPTSSNTGLFDEQLMNSLRKIGNVSPISLKVPLDEEISETILSRIRSNSPALILISGTAGEGKTRTERTIWERFVDTQQDFKLLSESKGGWEGKDFPSLKFENSSGKVYNVVFVKDLSPKLSKEDTPYFLKQALTEPIDNTCLVVACNHGMLLDHLRREDIKASSDHELAQIAEKSFFEKKQSSDFRLANNLQLNIFDLSTIPVRKRFKEIITEVCNREEWNLCKTCPFHGNCKILANRNGLWDDQKFTLRSPALRQLELLELLECTEIHIPVRDLLIIASNDILGTQKLGKTPRSKQLMTCELIKEKFERNMPVESYLFSNLLGQNLPGYYRKDSLVYREFSKFEIGNYSQKSYESLLEEPYVSNFKQHIPKEAFEALWEKQLILNNKVLEETLQKMKRQAFFFSIPEGDSAIEVDRWQFSSFRHGKNYFNYLRRAENSPSGSVSIPRELVKGMNRAFTGQFREEKDDLWVTTSGTSSRKLQGELVVVKLSISSSFGNQLKVKLFKENLKGISVVVFKDNNGSENSRLVIYSFNLSPFLFEYFMDLATGFTFNSFSREAGERAMKIKGQLVRFLPNSDLDNNEELHLTLLPTDKRQSIELTFETNYKSYEQRN